MSEIGKDLKDVLKNPDYGIGKDQTEQDLRDQIHTAQTRLGQRNVGPAERQALEELIRSAQAKLEEQK